MLNKNFKLLLLILLLSNPLKAKDLEYKVETFISTGFGDNIPFHIRSLKQGLFGIDKNQGLIKAGVFKTMDNHNKLDYGFGIDLVGAYNRHENFFVQEMYGELKYGWFDLLLGSKDSYGIFKNKNLSSGGLVWSGNSRPIPQLKVAFDRFHAVPGTKGWLQIYGDIAYGYFIDSPWLKDNFNYTHSTITTNVWYHHKSLFFRSKESKRFIFTLGAEFAAQFGGNYTRYINGEIDSQHKSRLKFTDFIRVLIPSSGGGEASIGDQIYFYGNHLGSWHINGEYNINKTTLLKAYTEWLFEDGSGIGKMNGWDGLWGLEYQNLNTNSILSGLVFEYLDTRNQGGPIHWAPNDHVNTQITTPATGADDYYNNYFYNGWAYFGETIGNPLLTGTIYNQDGYLKFKHTRVRALHIAAEGSISKEIKYKVRYSNNMTLGTPYVPRKKTKNNAANIEVNFRPSRLKGWSFNGALGLDRGELYGNNLGIMISIYKTGIIK